MDDAVGRTIDWLMVRIEELVALRQDLDYKAMTHGGASFESGYRQGKEEGLREALDIVLSTFEVYDDE